MHSTSLRVAVTLGNQFISETVTVYYGYMHFVRTTGWEEETTAITKLLTKELSSGKQVLWLVTGGSNIPASVKIMENLNDELTAKLAIFLTDERYGEVNHVNSNAKQLYDAGFRTKQAIFVPILDPGFSLAETQERYEQAVMRAFEHADVVVAQLGIGPDGHVAGLLPHSAGIDAGGWVVAYETPHYTRVSLTFEALRHVTVAYASAYGEERKPTLERLRDEQLALAEQPSQILKELPEAYIYNDQIGDS